MTTSSSKKDGRGRPRATGPSLLVSKQALALINHNGNGTGTYSVAGKPEASIVKDFTRYMRTYYPAVFRMKIVANVYQRGSMPDYFVDVFGHSLFLEFKRPGGDTTEAQMLTMQKLNESGAMTAVVTSADEAMRVFEAAAYLVLKDHPDGRYSLANLMSPKGKEVALEEYRAYQEAQEGEPNDEQE